MSVDYNIPGPGSDRIGWGLRVDFYRSARFGDGTGGGISSRFHSGVLVGIVDYRQVTKRLMMGTADGDPQIRLVPKHARQTEPSENSPPVWLVLGKTGPDDMYLIPGDLVSGKPDMRWWAHGGSYARGDSRFSDITGHLHAVRVHDHDPHRRREEYPG